MFSNQEIRNRNESFSNVFAKKATTLKFWIHKNGVKKRNRAKKEEYKKGLKQNEKPVFQDTEKTKKTWNINQCKKGSTKKETEKT